MRIVRSRFGLAQAFLDRARRLADFEAEVPQQVEQRLDHLLGVRGLLVRQQKHQVDVGVGRQLAAAIAADRDQGQPFARGRVGQRVDFGRHDVERSADQLIDQKALLTHHRGAVAAFFKAAPDLGPAVGERRLQRGDQRGAFEARRFDRARRGGQFVSQHAPVDDVALPRNSAHGASSRRRRIVSRAGLVLPRAVAVIARDM